MDEVLEAVDRLRLAAGAQDGVSRQVRLGTVTTATASLLVPALAALEQSPAAPVVELVTLMHDQVDAGVRDGSLDLGLVNVLEGDDAPVDLHCTPLLRGRAVLVLPAGHRLATAATVTLEDLHAEPFVLMRPGYLMHRVAARVFGSTLPARCHHADGAELAKTLVAEGLGLTVLPDFTLADDPLLRAGALTTRPLPGAGGSAEAAGVRLELRARTGARPGPSVGALHDALVTRAREQRGPGRTSVRLVTGSGA